MNILFFLKPKGECIFVYDDDSLRDVLDVMEKHRYASIPMISRATGAYRGTITEGDLLWYIKNSCGSPSVLRLVKKSGYPGMKVLLFAFDGDSDSEYLPHNYEKNAVVYTGTHDNDTIEGWVQGAKRKTVSFTMKYLHVKRKKDIRPAMIRAALSSVADTAIIPIQDYLGLDNSARMNLPSTLGENWKWRLLPGELTAELAEEMAGLAKLYGRN